MSPKGAFFKVTVTLKYIYVYILAWHLEGQVHISVTSVQILDDSIKVDGSYLAATEIRI